MKLKSWLLIPVAVLTVGGSAALFNNQSSNAAPPVTEPRSRFDLTEANCRDACLPNDYYWGGRICDCIPPKK